MKIPPNLSPKLRTLSRLPVSRKRSLECLPVSRKRSLISLLAGLLLSASAFASGAAKAPLWLELKDRSGKLHTAQQYRGQWLVVNYWATWCGPCRKEIPDLNAFDKARTDAAVVGVLWDESTPEEVDSFLKQTPINYPVLIVDSFDPPAKLIAPKALPLTLLVNPKGQIVQQFFGAVTGKQLAALIDAAPAPKRATQPPVNPGKGVRP
jgi:thiol-disulfide isomerase/thioredoxin